MREHQPDAAFAEPRLAEVYDIVDGKRDDLDAYAALAGRTAPARRWSSSQLPVPTVSIRMSRTPPGAEGKN